MSRIVCNFSAGAASAVATKLVLQQHPDAVIVTVEIEEEHPDNRRFRNDCEGWFGRNITVLRDRKYGGSVMRCWKERGFMKSRHGASCTASIKRAPLLAWGLPGDVQVLGFTAEEQGRADDWQDRHPDVQLITPLIELGLSKADCLAMVQRAGIELPAMYRLGFHNNNCVGCVKGGMGYWNRIREHFPERFAAIAQIQSQIGPSANLHVLDGKRISLLELPLDAGRHDEQMPDCSLFCELAEKGYTA